METIRGGELPPGTLRGEACRSSSDSGALASPVSLQPHPGLPESSGTKRTLNFAPITSLLSRVPPPRTESLSETAQEHHCWIRISPGPAYNWGKGEGRFCSAESNVFWGQRRMGNPGHRTERANAEPACDSFRQLLPGSPCGVPSLPGSLQAIPAPSACHMTPSCLTVPVSLVDTGRGCSQSPGRTFGIGVCLESTQALSYYCAEVLTLPLRAGLRYQISLAGPPGHRAHGFASVIH